MDYQKKYWEHVSQLIRETGEPTFRSYDAFNAGIAAERERILELFRETVERRRRAAELGGGPYSTNFALVEIEAMLND